MNCGKCIEFRQLLLLNCSSSTSSSVDDPRACHGNAILGTAVYGTLSSTLLNKKLQSLKDMRERGEEMSR